MRGSLELHNQIRDDVLIELGALPWLRIWKNETGAAYRNGKLIHYGVKGSPDIEGILWNGKYIGFEIKSGASVQSSQQIKWQAMIKKFGGYYFVVHSVEESLDFALQLKPNT